MSYTEQDEGEDEEEKNQYWQSEQKETSSRENTFSG